MIRYSDMYIYPDPAVPDDQYEYMIVRMAGKPPELVKLRLKDEPNEKEIEYGMEY